MKKKNIVSLMISADWHLGATDPYRFRLELIRKVKETLKRHKSLDLFVVAGDTFDMKEYLSSEVVKVFFLIMADLLELTEPFNTLFRIEEGTRTHDAMQLDTLDIVFSRLLNTDRVKFIQEVETESLLGLKVLYVPEEYVSGMDYYKEYFEGQHYDFIFGHGMTDLMWYMKGQNEKLEKQTSAPVFEVESLCKLANYIYFGHVHYHMCAGPDKRFKSIGPVTRWEFDKDKDCGFYYTEYDCTTGVAMEEFVVNEYAPILPTVAISLTKDYTLDKLNQLVTSKLKSVEDTADRTRLLIVLDTSVPSYLMMRDFILSSYGNLPNVKLVMKLNEPSEESKESDDVKPMEDLAEEKPYLYDKTMRDESRIAAFIKKKGGVNIPLENILDVISPKTNKIS